MTKLLNKPLYKLLFAALLFNPLAIGLLAHPPGGSHASYEEINNPDCALCCYPLDKDSIIIQLDCEEIVTHNYHLNCANDLMKSNLQKKCPECRKSFKIHDPRVNRNSYARVHHQHKALNPSEQALLREFLGRVGSRRISRSRTPDTFKRTCVGCKNEVAAGNVVIQFTCGHSACLYDAIKLASRSGGCPQCHQGITIMDPIKKVGTGQTTLIYQHRAPTDSESAQINQLRSCAHIGVAQEHIAVNQRVPVVKTRTSTPEPSKSGKGQTRPQIPQEILDEMTDEDYLHNFGHRAPKAKLPPAEFEFPDIELTEDDIALNMHLPADLDPREWQIIVLEDGNLALAKRTKKLSSWDTDGELDFQVSELFKGYNGDILAGGLFGLLIGGELGNPKPSMAQRALYLPALYVGYSLLKKANPGRKFKMEQAMRWGAGIGAGVLVHQLIKS